MILAFAREVGGTAVIKPLHGAGGAGVLLLRTDDKNARAIVETLTHEGEHHAMVQEYLPAVAQGDKRVLLLDGHVLGAINRVARPDEFRSNIHVGGRVEPCDVTDRGAPHHRGHIAPPRAPTGSSSSGSTSSAARSREVNVTSPTGIQELSRHLNEDVAVKVIRWVEDRAMELRPSLGSIPVP